MQACENEDSPRKVLWGGGSQSSHKQGDPSEGISLLSFPVTVLVQRTQVQLTKEGGWRPQTAPPRLTGLPTQHTAQTPSTGTHGVLAIHLVASPVTDMTLLPSQWARAGFPSHSSSTSTTIFGLGECFIYPSP